MTGAERCTRRRSTLRTSPCITCGRSEKMQKFVVTVETANASYELPVHAGSLEEALEVAEAEYEELGQVTRVRPDTNFGFDL
ncbi:RNA polymerase inhibitor [Klebsiella phage K5-4]|uniref:Bacterial RNA polymerase inhibitor n=33 Tax=Viruses TaxID=10239 RepID=A0A2U8USN8_9CAUD|nr:RNA polymerase inhibitor [Klebsiella phage K5-4]YP_009801402.1 RNA polymerase inhibitor [Klebsiella phage KP32_isolate 195]APZ82820.1 hypothetical protein k54_010 [Klebsiella phage K5-4]AWN07143.1 bacterial RNA polymerase inhibitor [Klebsiella phage KP32_isolate 195]